MCTSTFTHPLQAKAYEPLQYLLTTLYLLSHTVVQTDATCFWWRSEQVSRFLACLSLGMTERPMGQLWN